MEAQTARLAYGEEAEQSLLRWVLAQTEPLLTQPGARELLLAALPIGSATRGKVEQALDRGDLERALWVADLWSGAGYDLLGLEKSAEGQLEVVRYECKGLAAGTGRIRVFLSRRELAIARKVHQEGPGRWLLVGVEPTGRSINLTPLLADLLVESALPLEPLFDRGLEPDGLRLLVERRR